MTHITTRQGTGESTKLISVRLQYHHKDFAEEQGFALGKLINQAMFSFVHDLQTEYNVKQAIWYLSQSRASSVGYKQDYRGSVTKMVRLRSDYIEYLKMNKYKVNTAINIALDRWEGYFNEGRVADYVLRELGRLDGRSSVTYTMHQ